MSSPRDTVLPMASKQFFAHFRRADDQWQTLLSHLLGTARLSRLFAGKLGMPLLGELLGLLHDLGKYSQSFQTYLRSGVGALQPDRDDDWVDAASLKGRIDHSSAGAQFIWQTLSGRSQKTAVLLGQITALCIASHHSGLIDCLSDEGEDHFSRRMNKEDAETHLREVLGSADKALLERCDQLLNSPALLQELEGITKRIQQCNPDSDDLVPRYQHMGLLTRFLFSCLIAGDRIDTSNFENPDLPILPLADGYEQWPLLVARLESWLGTLSDRYPIDAIRRRISEDCLTAAERDKGIYTLPVPTGGGKTLASLRFALHHAQRRKLDRIIYITPFTSIIDQNAKVARQILEPGTHPEDVGRIVLEHHSNLTPERENSLQKQLSKDWNAPIVHTTMVQFLETLFSGGTRGARRMHQLANAVLVFDEVQTLPVRCVHLFNNALNFLVEQCNTTAVLCTATQPLLDQVAPRKGTLRLAETPSLIASELTLFQELKRVTLRDARKAGGWTDEEVAELALHEQQRTGSCLVIVNTKPDAQRLYGLIAARVSPDIPYHLSTGMCPAHRKRVLDDQVKPRRAAEQPVICVSTQLIEAGVDVDFGSVIRLMAGLDSIAQAAGRCNRNGRKETGTVHVVNLKNERLGNLLDIVEGQRQAERVLDDYLQDPQRCEHDLLSPQAMDNYYRYYFFRRKDEMSYLLKNKGRVDTCLLDLLSRNSTGSNAYQANVGEPPPLFMRHAFASAAKNFKALDAPTESVIVPYGKDGREIIEELSAAFDPAKDWVLLRRAQQYAVNVQASLLGKLDRANAIYTIGGNMGINCLRDEHYSQSFGLSMDTVGIPEASIW